MMLTSSQIESLVRDQLDWDARLDASEIDVDAEDHRVVLNGTVPSYLDKQAAVRDAYAVQDVGHVDNNLSVKLPEGQQRLTDEQIRTILDTVVQGGPGFYAPDILVKVESQVIYLQGTVRAYWEKSYIHDVAVRMPSVVEVVNWLTVSPVKDTPDDEIRNDLEKAISRSVVVDPRDVQVDVKQGIVTLSGAVPGWSIRQKVRELAENTRGVLDIFNNIHIRLPSEPPGSPGTVPEAERQTG
jgi:osmotically-inducible protein OsmY